MAAVAAAAAAAAAARARRDRATAIVKTKTNEPWTAFEKLVSSTRMSSASIHFVFAASTWPCSLLARHAYAAHCPDLGASASRIAPYGLGASSATRRGRRDGETESARWARDWWGHRLVGE